MESAHALYVHVAVCTSQDMCAQVLQNEQQARRAGHALPKTAVSTAHIQKSIDARKQACLSGYNRMCLPSVAFPARQLPLGRLCSYNRLFFRLGLVEWKWLYPLRCILHLSGYNRKKFNPKM